MPIYCYKCGHKNPAEASFCMKCGISLAEKKEVKTDFVKTKNVKTAIQETKPSKEKHVLPSLNNSSSENKYFANSEVKIFNNENYQELEIGEIQKVILVIGIIFLFQSGGNGLIPALGVLGIIIDFVWWCYRKITKKQNVKTYNQVNDWAKYGTLTTPFAIAFLFPSVAILTSILLGIGYYSWGVGVNWFDKETLRNLSSGKKILVWLFAAPGLVVSGIFISIAMLALFLLAGTAGGVTSGISKDFKREQRIGEITRGVSNALDQHGL